MKFNYSIILPKYQKEFKKLLSSLKKFKVTIIDNQIRAFGNDKELWFKVNIKGEITDCGVWNFKTEKFYNFTEIDKAIELLSKVEVKEIKKLTIENNRMRSLF